MATAASTSTEGDEEKYSTVSSSIMLQLPTENLDRLREVFESNLKLIQPAISLAGVESTINVPFLTSHKWLPKEEKRKQGITESLVRFSVGIEDVGDLKNDLNQALKKASDES